MGRHSDLELPLSRSNGVGATASGPRIRSPYTLPMFSFWIALAIILVVIIAPDSTAQAAVAGSGSVKSTPAQTQSLRVEGGFDLALARDSYGAKSKPKPKPVPVRAGAPAVGTPDPGSAQAIAYDMLQARGWGGDHFSCLVALWNHESGWNVYAHNPSSGAYGIPQSLPGSKMASAGADWQTNPATQITWGLGYIEGRYGSPCGAWSAFQSKGWY